MHRGAKPYKSLNAVLEGAGDVLRLTSLPSHLKAATHCELCVSGLVDRWRATLPPDQALKPLLPLKPSAPAAPDTGKALKQGKQPPPQQDSNGSSSGGCAGAKRDALLAAREALLAAVDLSAFAQAVDTLWPMEQSMYAFVKNHLAELVLNKSLELRPDIEELLGNILLAALSECRMSMTEAGEWGSGHAV